MRFLDSGALADDESSRHWVPHRPTYITFCEPLNDTLNGHYGIDPSLVLDAANVRLSDRLSAHRTERAYSVVWYWDTLITLSSQSHGHFARRPNVYFVGGVALL